MGFKLSWVCSRSQGQPPGARRRATSWTKRAKASPASLSGGWFMTPVLSTSPRSVGAILGHDHSRALVGPVTRGAHPVYRVRREFGVRSVLPGLRPRTPRPAGGVRAAHRLPAPRRGRKGGGGLRGSTPPRRPDLGDEAPLCAVLGPRLRPRPASGPR